MLTQPLGHFYAYDNDWIFIVCLKSIFQDNDSLMIVDNIVSGLNPTEIFKGLSETRGPWCHQDEDKLSHGPRRVYPVKNGLVRPIKNSVI